MITDTKLNGLASLGPDIADCLQFGAGTGRGTVTFFKGKLFPPNIILEYQDELALDEGNSSPRFEQRWSRFQSNVCGTRVGLAYGVSRSHVRT